MSAVAFQNHTSEAVAAMIVPPPCFPFVFGG